ncbi:MAG: 3'-5' exonuclease, partial [Thioalkalispiraceae bacterium]
ISTVTLSLPFVRRLLLPRSVKQRLKSNHGLASLYKQQQAIALTSLLDKPIAKSRFIIMDTETTGFHAYAGDQIVSIAMIEYQGLQNTGNIYQTLINPGRTIPAESTAIHGITDDDVSQAPVIEDALPDILNFIADGIIVGHHIQFDIRFLNKTLKPYLGLTLQNPWLDTMLLFLAHEKRLGHYQLEEATSHYGIEIHDRHTALGDAQAAGVLFTHLAQVLTSPSQPVFFLRNQQVKKEGL